MPKIHELIPVEADRSAAATAMIEEATTTFTKKADHFSGIIKKVTMFDEARQGENTTDYKELVETVDGKLEHVWDILRPAIDVQLTKENSNTSPLARADVIVNGVTILSDVPATALLALEKRLNVLRQLYTTIPTLNPALPWEPDTNAAHVGVMRTKYPQESLKTEKVMKVLTLAPATDKHPAQVEKYSMDENVAKVSTEYTSGLVSPATKAAWLKRITQLSTAVKEARQRANMADVIPLELAEDIRAFIHNG